MLFEQNDQFVDPNSWNIFSSETPCLELKMNFRNCCHQTDRRAHNVSSSKVVCRYVNALTFFNSICVLLLHSFYIELFNFFLILLFWISLSQPCRNFLLPSRGTFCNMLWRVVMFSRTILALGIPWTRNFFFALACSLPSSLLLCLRLNAYKRCLCVPIFSLKICWFPLSSPDMTFFLDWIFTAEFATDHYSANVEQPSVLQPIEEHWETSQTQASARCVEDACSSTFCSKCMRSSISTGSFVLRRSNTGRDSEASLPIAAMLSLTSVVCDNFSHVEYNWSEIIFSIQNKTKSLRFISWPPCISDLYNSLEWGIVKSPTHLASAWIGSESPAKAYMKGALAGSFHREKCFLASKKAVQLW